MSDNAFPQTSTQPIVDKNENALYSNADYKPVLSNWFTAKPYGFRFTPKEGATKVMYLPIGPSNLAITTHFATNITPTIYGTVEEHSPVRYFDIAIEGTTGMGPKFTSPMGTSETPTINNGSQKKGRTAFAIQSGISAKAQGFFTKTLNAADKAFNDATALIGKAPPPVTGLQLDQTGYIAFHNLYRFFLKYKKNVSGTDTKKGEIDKTTRAANAKHPFVFFNYKDNNEYNVIIKSFTLRRDKENPMLYYYNISMRGYDLKGIDNSDRINSIVETSVLLDALGLSGIKGSSFLGKAKEIASEAKSILGSVANGINQLGR